MKPNRLKEQKITQDLLKDNLRYNRSTGEFTRIKRVHGATVGKTAGCVSGKYWVISLKGEIYYAHRLAWLYVYGVWPQDQIDHINHNSLDNSIANLREVSATENQKNRSLSRNNKSGASGIRWCNQVGKWKASIDSNGNKMHLGYFENINDAISVRCGAEKKFNFHDNHGKELRDSAVSGDRSQGWILV